MKQLLKNGFLVLDKPQGWTSQKCVYEVRKHLGIKKAGHTGTLDPLATGVLPIALGEATKVIPYLDESIKVYRVTGKLGEATNTYDADGEVIHSESCSEISQKQIEEILVSFSGILDQLPPLYSAIKVKGRPLYEYARQGKDVELKARQVLIHKIELENFDLPYFTFKVTCSKGTYMRSLIHDLGKQLGCWAHVTKLRRLKSGPFEEGHAMKHDSEIFQKNHPSGMLPLKRRDADFTIEATLRHLPNIELNSIEEVEQIRCGAQIRRISQEIQNQSLGQQTVLLQYQHQAIALIKVKENGALSYGRVLNPH